MTTNTRISCSRLGQATIDVNRAGLKVKTYHHAQRWLPVFSNASGKLARWRRRSSGFGFDIVPRAGVQHQAADALPLPKDRGARLDSNDGLKIYRISWRDKMRRGMLKTTNSNWGALCSGSRTFHGIWNCKDTNAFHWAHNSQAWRQTVYGPVLSPTGDTLRNPGFPLFIQLQRIPDLH